MAQDKNNALITWVDTDTGQSKSAAFNEFYKALSKCQVIKASDVYRNVGGNNLSVRDEFTRQDFENFRPSDAFYSGHHGPIRASMNAYKQYGIIRNVIDLMGDFATQGIKPVHKNEKIDRFYKEWWKRTNLTERCERFANLLCRTANVVVKRQTAKITLKNIREFYKTVSSADLDSIEPTKLDVFEKREIPWKYTFLNPLSLEVIGEELSPFISNDEFSFALNIPPQITKRVKFPKNSAEKALALSMPTDIYNAIIRGDKTIPLDSDKVSSYYYKKDDWEVWASPMLSAILPDLNTLRKMKLADVAALDGAISQIRIWKLGDLKERILPSEAAINRLAEVLVNNSGGGILDLVWGPELTFQEVTSSLHNFLGEVKYVPTLNAIYAGLGIPPLFTGSTNQGSFTNNFLAIKTLIERLNYVRSVLTRFLQNEVEIVQKAMNFKEPAVITYDAMTLNDESSILAIVKDLIDRNILSDAAVQEMVGRIPEVEEALIKRQEKMRKRGSKPPKAGPFHSPNTQDDLKKSFAQSGSVTPSQVGLDFPKPKKGEITPNEHKAKNDAKYKPIGVAGQGRTKGQKDKVKRKAKVVKPRKSVKGFTQAFMFAEDAQQLISSVTTPIYIKSLKKKNLRQLTNDEFNNFEQFKFSLLNSFNINEELKEETIREKIKTKLSDCTIQDKLLNAAVIKYKENNKLEEVTIESKRKLQSIVYAGLNCQTLKEMESQHVCDLVNPVIG